MAVVEAGGVGRLTSHWRAANTEHIVRVFPPSAPRHVWSVTVGLLEIALIPVGADDDHLAFATAETFARQKYSITYVLNAHGFSQS